MLSIHWLLGRYIMIFKIAVEKHMLRITVMSIFCDCFLEWMQEVTLDCKSALVEAMAWCRYAASYYLNQCWPGSVSPYDVTKSELVNCGCVKYYDWSYPNQSYVWCVWSDPSITTALKDKCSHYHDNYTLMLIGKKWSDIFFNYFGQVIRAESVMTFSNTFFASTI